MFLEASKSKKTKGDLVPAIFLNSVELEMEEEKSKGAPILPSFLVPKKKHKTNTKTKSQPKSTKPKKTQKPQNEETNKKKTDVELEEFYRAKNAVFSAADKFQLVVEPPAKKKKPAGKPLKHIDLNSQHPKPHLLDDPILDVSFDTKPTTAPKGPTIPPKSPEREEDILPNIDSFLESELFELPSSNLELKENVIPMPYIQPAQPVLSQPSQPSPQPNKSEPSQAPQQAPLSPRPQQVQPSEPIQPFALNIENSTHGISMDMITSFRDPDPSISQAPLDISTPSKTIHENNNNLSNTPQDITTITPSISLRRSPITNSPQFKTPTTTSRYPFRTPLSLLSATKDNESVTINQSDISRFLDNSIYMNSLLSARKRKLQVSDQRTPKMSRVDIGLKLQTPNGSGYQPPLSFDEISALNLDLNLSDAAEPEPSATQQDNNIASPNPLNLGPSPQYPPEMLKEYQKYLQVEKEAGSTTIWNEEQFYQYVWLFSGL
eukprot:TRINITY_DN24249_c0_g1_i1.p1 TRINITY_DN24249_c0_g1~~TRINITY_DN24249_c0_g1_i1.p1  ORF type:complete len:491 (+),score=145.16 TRINITY_DN24249_c0_g1_i1:137-1609(+)